MYKIDEETGFLADIVCNRTCILKKIEMASYINYDKPIK